MFFNRYDGAGSWSKQSHIFAYVAEVPLLQYAGPRSVAPSGCGHGQRLEEELCDLGLLQWQSSGDRKGMLLRGEGSCTDSKSYCSIHVFIHVSISCQMKYIQPFPGQHVSMDPSAVIDVYGVMGTPPLWKEYAAVVWRVGPSYLFEEALSSEAVGAIYTQGTAYLGNFLALRNTSESALH